jgi:NRPS condensation-like uncharacterized protein
MSIDQVREFFGRIVKAHAKLRSRITKVLGDLYYKELDFEEVMSTRLRFLAPGTIKSRKDLEHFCSQKLAEKFSKAEPHWEVSIQQGFDGDKVLIVWKIHHSIADGLSVIGMHL